LAASRAAAPMTAVAELANAALTQGVLGSLRELVGMMRAYRAEPEDLRCI